VKYIYNFKQAQFFIENGAAVLGCGIGDKGDCYIKFLYDDKYEQAFLKWRARAY
jgi:hypothetical protein